MHYTKMDGFNRICEEWNLVVGEGAEDVAAFAERVMPTLMDHIQIHEDGDDAEMKKSKERALRMGG